MSRKIRVALLFWGVTTVVWAVLLVPSLLWWKDSILWIIVMSWWANVAASAAAFYSVWTEAKSQERHDNLEVGP